jgi:hypothetical protein
LQSAVWENQLDDPGPMKASASDSACILLVFVLGIGSMI